MYYVPLEMTAIYHFSQLSSHTIRIRKSNISREQLKTTQKWKNKIAETYSIHKKSVDPPGIPRKHPLLFASLSIPVRKF